MMVLEYVQYMQIRGGMGQDRAAQVKSVPAHHLFGTGENLSEVGWGSAELVGRGIFAIPNLLLWLLTSQYIVSKSSFMKPLLSLELVLNVKTYSAGYIFWSPFTKNCSLFSFLFQLFV